MTRLDGPGLEAALRSELASIRSESPLPRLLLDVPDRCVREHPMSSPLRGILFAAVILSAAFLTSALVNRSPQRDAGSGPGDAGVGVPVEEFNTQPIPAHATIAQPSGDALEVARGRVEGVPFAVVAYIADGGRQACLELNYAERGGGGCGQLPGSSEGSKAFGLTLVDPSVETHAVIGLVSSRAARVWIETSTGRAEARLIPLGATGIDGQGFVAFLPDGIEASAVEAADGDGMSIGRFAFTQPSAPTGGPQPTPVPR